MNSSEATKMETPQASRTSSDKWRDALGGCDTDSLVRLAQGLEDLKDVSVLTEAFTATKAT